MKQKKKSGLYFVQILTAALLCGSVVTARAHDHIPLQRGHDAHYQGLLVDLETGVSNEGTVFGWELDGWIGDDLNKLGLKSEGIINDNKTEKAEIWGLYSRQVTDFWDLQLGWRYDLKPHSLHHLLFGFEGLAPNNIETEAHVFVSEDGDISARLHIEKEYWVSQHFIVEPSFGTNLYAQDVRHQEIGAGLSDIELGLQLRYAVTKNFAPFVKVAYEQKFGKTSSFAKALGNHNHEARATVGFQFLL